MNLEDVKQSAGDVSQTAQVKPLNPQANNSDKFAASPPPTVAPARVKRRHKVLFVFFFCWVILPLVLTAGYLYGIAKNQYASHIGFSVRSEETNSALDILGGLTELSGSSSTDTDILYEFIRSPQMVRAIHEKHDLRKIYALPGDPFFTLGEDIRIEALSNYWERMVKVFYDNSSGLIEIRVLAFEPEDAHGIAQSVFDESSQMINRLSAIAREDTTRYAREELDRALERLKMARLAKTKFQSRTQIVDPAADIQGRMGLLNTLNAQLAEISIERELLLENALPGDPRLTQIESRLEAVRKLIQEERNRFGSETATENGDPEQAYVDLLGEFEVLEVEREFAEKAYLAAQATYDAALAEAQRTSRYLATYLGPTRAETAEYPQRITILATIAMLLLVSWAILVMVYYSLRDRR